MAQSPVMRTAIVTVSLLSLANGIGCGAKNDKERIARVTQAEPAFASTSEAEAEPPSPSSMPDDPYWDIDRMYALRESAHEWEIGQWNEASDAHARQSDIEARLQRLENSKPSPPSFEQREWTSADARFRTEATLVDARIDSAKLSQATGRTIEVPRSKLDGDGRLYIDSAFAELTSYRKALAAWDTEHQRLESELKAASLKVAEVGELKPMPTLPSREEFAKQIAEERRDRELRRQTKIEELRKTHAIKAEQLRIEAEKAAAKQLSQELTVDGLILHTESVSMGHDRTIVRINGVVESRRKAALSLVTIYFNLYDESGAQVGDATDTIRGLEPGSRWKFEAIGDGKGVASYKFIRFNIVE